MAKHGVFKFALFDQNALGAEVTINLLKIVRQDTDCMFIQVDVSDHSALTRAVRDAVGHFKRIDYAVSNVGIPGPVGSSITFSATELQHVLNINLVSQFTLQKELIAHMQSQPVLAMTSYVPSTHSICLCTD